MERTNVRTVYNLTGEVGDYTFNGEVVVQKGESISINGNFTFGDSTAHGNYTENVEGGVSSNISGQKGAVSIARDAFPQLVEQERAYIATLYA